MGRIADAFAARRGRGMLLPFVVGGHPSLDVTRAVLPKLAAAGAGVIEVGIPFSDPIADGPVIAAAMHEALESGVTPAAILDLVRDVRGEVDAGLVAMVSVSIVDRLGGPDFIARTAEAGFDGFIVPDCDATSAPPLRDACRAHDLAFAMLIAPTTSDARIAELCGLSEGFVYLLARAGITGESGAAPEIAARIDAVRARTDLPIACGFGISTPDHVRTVLESADGAIVGSALVRRMEQAGPGTAADEAARFTADLAGVLPD